MAAKLIDGRKIAKEIKDEVKFEVEKMVKEGRRSPSLCVVLVGDDPASKTYIKNKIKACQYTGTRFDMKTTINF